MQAQHGGLQQPDLITSHSKLDLYFVARLLKSGEMDTEKGVESFDFSSLSNLLFNLLLGFFSSLEVFSSSCFFKY